MTPAIQRFERRLLVSAWLLAGCAVAGIAGSVTLDEGTLARHAAAVVAALLGAVSICLLYTSPSPRDATLSRMPSSA